MQLRRLQVDRALQKGARTKGLNIGGLHVNVPSRSVHIDGEQVGLTTMEFDILAMLAKETGAVVKRDDLYTHVLGIEYDGIDHVLDVHVSRIRRKLKAPALTHADLSPCAASATSGKPMMRSSIRLVIFSVLACWAIGFCGLAFLRQQAAWTGERARQDGVFLARKDG